MSVIKPGRILFEVDGVTVKKLTHAFRDAGHKLPIKTKVVGAAFTDESYQLKEMNESELRTRLEDSLEAIQNLNFSKRYNN